MFTTEPLPDCFLLLWICEPIPLPYQLEDIRACSRSCYLGIIFITLKILAEWSSLRTLWRGKKCRCLKYPAQKHCSPSLEKSLAHLYWEEAVAANRAATRRDERPSLGLGAPERLTALKFLPSLPFWAWRAFFKHSRRCRGLKCLPIPMQEWSHFHLMYEGGIGHTVYAELRTLLCRDTQ